MKHLNCAMALSCAMALGFAGGASQAANFQTLHRFSGGDGAAPAGGLIMGASGLLYGTTYSGGSGGGGTIFSFDPASSTLTTLYSFSNTGTGGSGPIGALVMSGSKVYGVTQVGGGTPCHNGCGVIFELNTVTKNLTTLYRFSGLGDGLLPSARLIFDSTKTALYGTTELGGDTNDCSPGCGTVFKLVLATTTLTTLHQFSFDGAGGAFPETGVAMDSAGLLYGTTSARGSNGSGTLYQLDPGAQAYTVLHEFDLVNGYFPMGDVALKQGVLYGSTYAGGDPNTGYGTIFAYAFAGQTFTTLHSLDLSSDGGRPVGPLLAGAHHRVFGTASEGGAGDEGTVFSFDTMTSAYKVLYAFTGGADGAIPQAGVIEDHSGALYGVTSYANGTIFKITP